MRVKELIIERVPLIFPATSFVPYDELDEFPTSCGPGKIGALFIPDRPYGVDFSPACWSHDEFFRLAPPSVDGFIFSNSIFQQNLSSLISYSAMDEADKRVNRGLADLYYRAVASNMGLSCFCKALDNAEKFAEWSIELMEKQWAT